MGEHGPTQERWAAWAVRLGALRVPPAGRARRSGGQWPARPPGGARRCAPVAGVWTERALATRPPDPATSIELADAWLAAGDAARAEAILRAASRADTRASSLARLRLATLERLRGSHAATRVALEGSRSLRPVGLEYAAAFEHPELLSRPLVARATDALDRSSPRDILSARSARSSAANSGRSARCSLSRAATPTRRPWSACGPP